MKVAVVAEYYPRPSHPGLGIWAHRQAQAVRERGVDVRVLVLERPLPSLNTLRSPAALRDWVGSVRRQPAEVVLDGIAVRYVRYLSPPRPLSYASWGRWAARPLGKALGELRRGWEFDLVHAHYAVPAGDAVIRSLRDAVPLVLSVHGGDLFYTAARSDRGRDVVSRVFRSADAILANSELTRRGVQELGGERVRVVHPGTDVIEPADRHEQPTLITVGNLEKHKGQEDVIRAVATLRDRHPGLRYVLVGGGPDRPQLERLAGSLGVGDRVSFTGAVEHDRALSELARAHVHVMPSRIDAFGVAHVEAMAAGLPTIGGAGTGAEEIAAADDGAIVVRPGDVGELVRILDGLLGDEQRRRELGEAARRTAAEHFSWERNGMQTVSAYEAVTGG